MPQGYWAHLPAATAAPCVFEFIFLVFPSTVDRYNGLRFLLLVASTSSRAREHPMDKPQNGRPIVAQRQQQRRPQGLRHVALIVESAVAPRRMMLSGVA